MRKNGLSRICLMFVPVLAACFMALAAGPASARWVSIYGFKPGPDDNYLDLSHDYGECAPAAAWRPNGTWPHYSRVNENDGTSTTVAISTQGVGNNYPLTDAYVAVESGTYENSPTEAYFRELVVFGEYPAQNGHGWVTVEVFSLNGPYQTYCPDYMLEDFATLIDTYTVDFGGYCEWSTQCDTIDGAGDDPASDYGIVLRVTGERYGTQGYLAVDELRVVYFRYYE